MKRYLIATTLALLAAAPAMANDQLAMSLGFEPGKYTTSELAALSLADGRDDRWLKREILSDGADIISTQSPMAGYPSGMNPGKVQLAMSLGLEPGKYTSSELAALSLADGRDDRWLKREILSDGADIISTQSPMAGYPGGMNPGKVQLARGLGLDPADYTTAELARKFLSEYGTTN